LDISPYVGGESDVQGATDVIRLASNESALGASPKARAAYESVAGELHRYPDGASLRLRQAIGCAQGIDPARIVCGAGSDELLSLLGLIYAGPGDEVVYSEYGFLMYKILTHAVGATPVVAPESNYRTDIEAILAAVNERTRLVILANPNNPTGTYLSHGEVERLRAGLRDDVVLVIDAAYAEYVEADDYTPGIELVDGGENVVMARTFSKIYGLAALRLGWCYAPPSIADLLNRVRGPFNVTAAAQAAGEASVNDVEFMENSRRHNSQWRALLSDGLSSLGLTVTPSVANFVLVHFADAGQSAAAANFLKGRNILVRAMGGYGLPQCLRIGIGREEENTAVIETLGEFLKA
jgi:histidinol-phosphate aminotransferase